MKSGRRGLAQDNTRIGRLDRLVDAAEQEPRQFAGGRSSHAGWLWPETADLASLAVASGFTVATYAGAGQTADGLSVRN
jgi:hypothetical protein